MCFSATASFTAGAALSAAGVYSISKVKNSDCLPFAAIPLLFGGQQIVEGFLWLALTNPEYAFLEQFTAYSFLIFAQVIWPFWVPFSIHKFTSYRNSRILNIIAKFLILLGVLVSVTMAYYLYEYPVNGKIHGCHISYDQTFPQQLGLLGGILYLIATIAPHFTTSNRRMWVLGISVLGSYIFTELFYSEYVVSVWCFFAAILSMIILWIVSEKKRA